MHIHNIELQILYLLNIKFYLQYKLNFLNVFWNHFLMKNTSFLIQYTNGNTNENAIQIVNRIKSYHECGWAMVFSYHVWFFVDFSDSHYFCKVYVKRLNDFLL